MAKKGLLYTHCSWAVVSQTGITLCTSLLCGTFQNKLWHRYDDIIDDWLCIQVTATGGNKEKTLEAGIWKKPALGALGSARNINKRNGERHAQVCPFLTSAKKHRDERCLRVQTCSRPCDQLAVTLWPAGRDPVTSWPLLNVADFIDVKSKSLVLISCPDWRQRISGWGTKMNICLLRWRLGLQVYLLQGFNTTFCL